MARFARQTLIAIALGLFFVVSLLPVAGFAQSQATTGVIDGTVVDAQGGNLPGVTVVVRNTATNFQQDLVTDARGRFRAVLLPLGPYEITASLEGFATVRRDGLQLTVGQTISLRIEMQLATVRDEIVVTGEAALVEVGRVDNAVTVGRSTIEGIPNNGRNFLEFTKLTPGVAVVQGPDGDELSINGQKGIQNNISVDGADFNNPFFGEQRGGQRPAFTFNIDAVQEFVVVPDGAPAEFGRSSSGFVNVVTKSGTNAYRGTANLFFKNDSLSTEAKRRDGTNEPKFESEQTQVGFTLGGPIKQDKVFFFTAADVQAGDSTKQNDPNRIEQRVVDAFAALGSPNENGPIQRTNDATAWLGKVDFQASSRNLFTIRGTYTDATQENGTFDVDSWGQSANAIEDNKSKSISGSLVSTINDSALNELRFQWAREDRPRPYNGPNITGQSRPLPDTAFDFGRAYRFGMPFFIPVTYHDIRYQLNDNVTWLKGDHTIKGGVEYNDVESIQTFIGFANGRFIFGSTDGFLNYVKNPKYVECSNGTSSQTGVCPAGTNVTGPVLLYLQQAGVGGLTAEQAGTQGIPQKEPALFIQDKWQPRANLTVSAGLRWEALLNAAPITPASQVFYAPFIGKTVNGQRFPSDGNIPDDKDQWQPRLGVAWDPWEDGKSVVRASAGLYHARVPGLVLASSRSTNGSRGQTLFRNSALIGILGPTPAYTQLIPQSQIGDPFFPDVFVFDENFQTPRTAAYAIAFEREFMPRTSFLAKFNYAKTEHLTRFTNRNDPLLGSPWGSGLAPAGINGINTLTVVESTAQSLYRGYTVGLTRHSESFDFQGFYTYSKDKSDDDNERDPFSFRYARITELDKEWSFSDRDQRDRLNASALWRAPHGINVNGRLTYRSAQPLSLTETGAVASGPGDRINQDGTVTRRNLGRKDNKFTSVDVRVSRGFDLGNMTLEAIFEVFNLTNSKNLKVPQATNLVFNFDGTVTSGLGDPRQIQLGLRLSW